MRQRITDEQEKHKKAPESDPFRWQFLCITLFQWLLAFPGSPRRKRRHQLRGGGRKLGCRHGRPSSEQQLPFTDLIRAVFGILYGIELIVYGIAVTLFRPSTQGSSISYPIFMHGALIQYLHPPPPAALLLVQMPINRCTQSDALRGRRLRDAQTVAS